MTKSNVLVVEDEAIVSRDIQHSLKKMGYNIIGAVATGEKSYEMAAEMKPDIILMDIMLKGKMNGIETANKIKKELKIPVIFLTAYADEDTLGKAKITEPYGYIIKPFKDIDLQTSIEMAVYKVSVENEKTKLLDSLMENKEGVIFIKSNSRLIKLKSSEILFVEALKDYVIINTEKNKHTIHSTMKDIEKKLMKNDFQRVHRSYIVRIDKIVDIEQSNITVEKNNKLIPIGGSYKEELFRRINLI